MRCEVGGIFADLGPDKFNRVEFWSAGRKVINMQARVLSNELLNKLAFMDGMVIPHQNDLTRNCSQQLLQKSDDLFTTQAVTIRANGQFDLAPSWANQQRTQQVQPLVMRQAGAEGGRMSTRRPTPFERRDQREAAFIFKYQRGQQLTPLFLSLARPTASRKQWLPRHVGSPGVAPSGCSSPCDPSHTRHRWIHIVSRTVPRSHDQSAPASSNLLHIREHKLPVTTLAPAAGSAHPSGVWAVQADVRFSFSDFSLPGTSAEHSAPSSREVLRLLWRSSLAQVASALVFAFRQVVHRFHRVSCPYYHISTIHSAFDF